MALTNTDPPDRRSVAATSTLSSAKSSKFSSRRETFLPSASSSCKGYPHSRQIFKRKFAGCVDFHFLIKGAYALPHRSKCGQLNTTLHFRGCRSVCAGCMLCSKCYAKQSVGYVQQERNSALIRIGYQKTVLSKVSFIIPYLI